MKKLFTLFTIALVTVTFAQQKLIAIKGTTTDAIATTLDEAINIAQPNDKIYLPGGNFEYTGSLEKPIHLIGVGFQNGLHVDGNTVIGGNIFLSNLSNGCIFEGFYLTGYFGINNNTENIIIKRCNILGIGNNGLNDNLGVLNNSSLINVISRQHLDFGFDSCSNGCHEQGTNNLLVNCFFNHLTRVKFSTVSNCIVTSNYSIGACSDSNIKNSIFSYYGYNGIGGVVTHSSSNNLIFNNNVFFSGNSSTIGDGVLSNLNPLYYNSSATEVFTTASDFTFNPTFDFQLQSSFAGNNAGDDGTDVGIYGGQYPWKNGSLPISPNIEQNNSFLDVQNEQFKLRVKVVPQTN